jgi:hypothetical protein
MKPGDHPEFFRFPAPEGRSRESTIRLDGQGRFWHEGALVEHAGLARALATWISRHPDDGRYILTNGYDWTYFTVDDVPYFVRSLRVEPPGGEARDAARVTLLLSDGSEEAWDPASTRVGQDDGLYATVKRDARGGPYEAKLSRHAQASLEPLLVEGPGGQPAVRIGGQTILVGTRAVPIGARFE